MTEPNDAPTDTPLLSAELRRALEDLYQRVDREISSSGVGCWLKSRCCDFETSDHVLFASSIELSYVREAHPESFPAGNVLCPFWKNGLCEERERRPLGCRTYFCDPAFEERTRAIHERYHREIRELCERDEVTYSYAPFVATLRGDNGDRDDDDRSTR